MASLVDLARFAVGVALLGYASVRDLRVRRVPNRAWLVGGAASLALLLYDAAVLRDVPSAFLLLALVLIALAYTFWKLHLIAGGADAKALMVVAVLAPTPVALDVGGRALPLWPSLVPPSFATFGNSLLLFLVVPLAFAAYNLAKGDVAWPAMFLGYRLPLAMAAARFVWVMEHVGEDGRLRLVLFASRIDADDHAANLARLRERGVELVWVTPKVPYMVPLLAGFVAAFLVGDLVSHLIVNPLVGR